MGHANTVRFMVQEILKHSTMECIWFDGKIIDKITTIIIIER